MLLDWRVKEFLVKIEERDARLRAVYASQEEDWKNELSRLEGDPAGVEIWSQFYEEAKALKGASVQGEWLGGHEAEWLLSSDAKNRALQTCLSSFTSTESFGRFLDLSSLHLSFNALPGLALSPVDYLSFLTALIDNHFLPTANQPTRKAPEYLNFVTELAKYVQSFIERTKPLVNLGRRIQELKSHFDESWASKTFVALSLDRIEAFRGSRGGSRGEESAMEVDEAPACLYAWMRRASESGSGGIWQDGEEEVRVESVEWLEPWVLEGYFLKAKEVVVHVATGTPSTTEPARSYYCPCCCMKLAKETVWKSHVGSKKHHKNVTRYEKHIYEVSWQEVLIFELLKEAGEALEATKEQVEKKQARRPGEASHMDAGDLDDHDEEYDDDEEGGGGGGDSDEDEDEKRRRRRLTKKNYPVGPDGNPLPYWLYRLQGLSHEFKCQICGNASYFGRKAFERHFTDARHTYGLKCLGIDNSRDFFQVTSIDSARELHQRLTAAKTIGKWDPNTMEEFEDEDGTVMDKATHDLLARQLSGY